MLAHLITSIPGEIWVKTGKRVRWFRVTKMIPFTFFLPDLLTDNTFLFAVAPWGGSIRRKHKPQAQGVSLTVWSSWHTTWLWPCLIWLVHSQTWAKSLHVVAWSVCATWEGVLVSSDFSWDFSLARRAASLNSANLSANWNIGSDWHGAGPNVGYTC